MLTDVHLLSAIYIKLEENFFGKTKECEPWLVSSSLCSGLRSTLMPMCKYEMVAMAVYQNQIRRSIKSGAICSCNFGTTKTQCVLRGGRTKD